MQKFEENDIDSKCCQMPEEATCVEYQNFECPIAPILKPVDMIEPFPTF